MAELQLGTQGPKKTNNKQLHTSLHKVTKVILLS